MIEKLQPILFEIDHESIAKEINLWQQLIESLNGFFVDWHECFNEELSLEGFRAFQEIEDKEFFLGKKYLLMKEEHANFIEKMKIKVKEYLRFVDLPSFKHLLSGSEKVASLMLQVHADDLRSWLDRCKVESGFFVPEEFVSELHERYSTYATTPVEILAYHYLCQFCELINIMASTGRQFDTTDFPPVLLHGNVVWRLDDDTPWLAKPPRYCEPTAGFLRKDSVLIASLSKLPEDYILELVEKYSGT